LILGWLRTGVEEDFFNHPWNSAVVFGFKKKENMGWLLIIRKF